MATNKSIRIGSSSPGHFNVILRQLLMKSAMMLETLIFKCFSHFFAYLEVTFRQFSIKIRTMFVAEIDPRMLFLIFLPIKRHILKTFNGGYQQVHSDWRQFPRTFSCHPQTAINKKCNDVGDIDLQMPFSFFCLSRGNLQTIFN